MGPYSVSVWEPRERAIREQSTSSCFVCILISWDPYILHILNNVTIHSILILNIRISGGTVFYAF